jgi:hypothetical protein
MGNDRIFSAAQMISDTLAELHEVSRQLAAGLPADDLETTARILDRLSEDLADAASEVRGGFIRGDDSLLRRLLDSGHQITFSRDPLGYVASVSGPGGYERDAITASPLEALLATVPEGFLGEDGQA